MTHNHSETGSTDVGKPTNMAHTESTEQTPPTPTATTPPCTPTREFNAEDPAIPLSPTDITPPPFPPSSSSTSSSIAHTTQHSGDLSGSHHGCTACLRKKQKPASLRFTVQTVMGAVYAVKCRETDTFSYLTFKLYAKTALRPDRQRLVLDDKELVCEEEWTLKECGIRNGCVLTLAPYMAAGFVTHLRSTNEKPAKQPKMIQAEEKEEPAPAPKKRDAQWWKEKQGEHENLRSKVEELRQKMAENKKKSTQ